MRPNPTVAAQQSVKGLTLVELLCSLAIIVILTGLVMPGVAKIHSRSKATSGVNWIIGAVNFTRHAAVNHRITATLCPSPDGRECSGAWHDGVMVFADHNRDAVKNGRDFLIERISADTVDGTLKWRSFRNRQYLQFTQLGYTNYQNGNFVYCPASQDLHFARQIVINVQGRARVVHTVNDEGLRVDRKGKLLRC